MFQFLLEIIVGAVWTELPRKFKLAGNIYFQKRSYIWLDTKQTTLFAFVSVFRFSDAQNSRIFWREGIYRTKSHKNIQQTLKINTVYAS